MTAAPKISREEFIGGYVRRSNVEKHRTADGFTINGRRQVAMRCYCDAPECEGWAMVSGDIDSIETHLQFDGRERQNNE